MAPAYSYAAQLGIGDTSTVDARLDFQECTIGVTETHDYLGGLRGTRSMDVTRVREGIRRVGGRIALQPSETELKTQLAAWILGGTPSGSSYPLGDSLSSKYVAVDHITKVPVYSGCKVDRATFRAQQGGPMRLELDIVGVDESVGNAATFPALSIPTDGPWVLYDLAITVGGTSYQVRDYELTIDNMLDKERFFNSQTLSTAYNATGRSVNVALTLPYGDAVAAYNLGATGSAVVATFTNGSSELVQTMSKVCFPRQPREVRRSGERGEEIMMQLRGIAYANGATLELTTTIT